MTIEEVIRLYALLAVGAIACAGVFALGWYRARRRVSELETQLSEPPTSPVLMAEVDELRQRLDLLDDQVDRISDGQEFLSRVVTDR